MLISIYLHTIPMFVSISVIIYHRVIIKILVGLLTNIVVEQKNLFCETLLFSFSSSFRSSHQMSMRVPRI